MIFHRHNWVEVERFFAKPWRQWMLIPGLAAACGAVYLIIDWMGPIGGGG